MSTSGGSVAFGVLDNAEISMTEAVALGATPQVIVPGRTDTGLLVPILAVLNLATNVDELDFAGGAPQLRYATGPAVVTFPAGFGVLGTGKFDVAIPASALRPSTLGGDALVLGTVGNVNPTRTASPVTVAIAAGGLGYVVGDRVTINGPAAPVSVSVHTVGALGVVTSLVNLGNGAGYDTTHNPHATTAVTGVGVGLTVNVTAITPPAGDIYVDTAYHVTRYV